MTEREDSLARLRDAVRSHKAGRATSIERGNDSAVKQHDAEIERLTRLGQRIKAGEL